MESRALGFVVLAVLRFLGWVYAWAPAPMPWLMARGLGFALRLAAVRSRVVRENLEIAFPSDADARARNFGEAYAHLGHLFFEVCMLLSPQRVFKPWISRYAQITGTEHWRDASARGQGVVFLASHVGNWEMMAATGSLVGGIDVMLVTKHLKPEWLHRAIERGRQACGVDATYEPRTMRDILGRLKAGRTLGFVLDQYAGAPVGVRVPVFGRPVGTSMALATFVRRTGAAVLPVVNYRVFQGGHFFKRIRWRVEIRAPLEWQTAPASEPDSELALNTARYAQAMEGDILAHSDQWLWIHRRFKGDLSPLRPGEWSEGRART